LEKNPKRELADYLNRMILQHHYYHNIKTSTPEEGLKLIQETARSLDLFYNTFKIRIQCEAIYMNRFLPADRKTDDPFKKWNIPPNENAAEHPLPYLYNALKGLLESENFENFDKISDAISIYADRIGEKELDWLLLFLHGVFSALNRTNPLRLNEEKIHRLNRLALEHNMFARSGELPVGHFLNIVFSACRANDYDWIPRFVEACRDQLPEPERTNAENMSKVIMAIERKEYQNALDMVQGIQSKDIYIQIRVKIYPLVCHYELDVPGVDVYDLCTKTEAFLKNHQKPLNEAVRSALNFIGILKMLASHKADQQKIMERINSTPLLILRHWLLEKAGKYSGG
jgi:hypothetical protein